MGYTQPLIPMVWKALLKQLNSNLFSAKAALLAAIANCEGNTWQPTGLVQGGPQAVQPYIGSLVGQPQSAKHSRSVLTWHQALKIYMLLGEESCTLKGPSFIMHPCCTLSNCFEPDSVNLLPRHAYRRSGHIGLLVQGCKTSQSRWLVFNYQ